MIKVIDWTLSIKTVSEANLVGEHWTVKHKRHAAQKLAIVNEFKLCESKVTLPCTIILTRIAPRMLDADDNLRMALKNCKDYIADAIIPGLQMGRADASKKIVWAYTQVRGEPRQYAVRIEVFCGM